MKPKQPQYSPYIAEDTWLVYCLIDGLREDKKASENVNDDDFGLSVVERLGTEVQGGWARRGPVGDPHASIATALCTK